MNVEINEVARCNARSGDDRDKRATGVMTGELGRRRLASGTNQTSHDLPVAGRRWYFGKGWRAMSAGRKEHFYCREDAKD